MSARIEVISMAFRDLKADNVIICDDDDHQRASNTPTYLDSLQKGADLVIGSRSFLNMATHPPQQWWSEELSSFVVNLKLKLPASKGRILFPDFLSGGEAFSAKGWGEFEDKIKDAKLPDKILTDTFIPTMYKHLGLKIDVIDLYAPFEDKYFIDGLSIRKLKNRYNVFVQSFKGIKTAEQLIKN